MVEHNEHTYETNALEQAASLILTYAGFDKSHRLEGVNLTRLSAWQSRVCKDEQR